MLNGSPENKMIDPSNPNQKIANKIRDIDKLINKVTSPDEKKKVEVKKEFSNPAIKSTI